MITIRNDEESDNNTTRDDGEYSDRNALFRLVTAVLFTSGRYTRSLDERFWRSFFTTAVRIVERSFLTIPFCQSQARLQAESALGEARAHESELMFEVDKLRSAKRALEVKVKETAAAASRVGVDAEGVLRQAEEVGGFLLHLV